MADRYTLRLSDVEIERYRLMAERARRQEQEAWIAAGVTVGARVADIGCGPGAVLAELASLVGPTGFAVGVERDEDAIVAARSYLQARNAINARVIGGDAANTGLVTGTFDVVMMRHVLIHNGSRVAQILRHLLELLRTGGSLYLVESDLTAFRRVPPVPELDEEHARWQELVRREGNDVAIGAKLGHWVREIGLELVEFVGRFDILWGEEMVGCGPPRAARQALLDAGLASEEEARGWDAAGVRFMADRAGRYYCVPIFRATGRRS